MQMDQDLPMSSEQRKPISDTACRADSILALYWITLCEIMWLWKQKNRFAQQWTGEILLS